MLQLMPDDSTILKIIGFIPLLQHVLLKFMERSELSDSLHQNSAFTSPNPAEVPINVVGHVPGILEIHVLPKAFQNHPCSDSAYRNGLIWCACVSSFSGTTRTKEIAGVFHLM